MLSIRTAAKRRFAATLIALALIVMTTAVPAWAAACSANVCTIATGADLVSALTTIDGDPTNAYTVNFAANVTLDTTTTLPYIASTSTVTINGNGFTLDGGGVQRGFFANTGTISISSLTISNTLAQGGNGGEGFRTGGGGAGLGGAIFVAAGASVAISGVSLTTNKAAGGHGGDFCCGGSSALASGGGGMGGDGGNGAPANGGETGGGGLGLGATGAVVGGTGSAGIATGATSGGTGTSGRAAGANGGGGSADVTFGDDAAGGGGIGGHNSSGMNGGAGGFGGGGGGGENNGGAGGFGGGGGTGFDGSGGNGGFGGGGGADAGSGSPGAGGFGGGAGSSAGGGGGLGAGGAIFVQQGGTLTVSDAVAVTGNTVAAGRQSNFEGTLVGSPGAALGSGIFLQGNGTLGFTPNGATQTIANAIADQTGNGGSGGNAGVYAVTITGPGTVALTGANSYSGGTTVTGAIVQVSADSGFGKASGAVTLSGGSTLQIAGGAFSSARSYVISGTGANAESFDTNGNNATFSGTISGAGDFDKIGIGTLTLSHLGTYSGATVVNAGTLKAGAANVLPTGTTLNVGSAGTFDTSTFNQTFNQLIGSGSVVMTGGGATLTVGGDNADTEFDGVLSGAGTFAKTGTGALTLTGANINTGTTTLSAGTIRAGNASVFSSSSAFNVTSTGTLDLAGFNESVGSLAGAGAVTLGSGTLTTSGNASTTFSGSIGGTGGLTKAGTGTFTLSGSDGYSGATTVSGGALTAAVANAFGVNSAVTIATGATLNLNNFSQSIGSLAGSGAASLGSATLTTGTDNTNTTFGGTITGAGAFVKTGTGTLTLASASAYTGTTSVSGGTLQAGAANVFASPSAYTIGGSGTLDLNNFNQTLSSLGGSGNITLGTATLTLATATNPVFAGNISGSGGLTTTGSGVFTLSGSNAYTGATVLGSATLRAGAANAFSAGSQIVTTGATLDLNGFDQTIGSLSGNGTVTLGSGQLTLGADNTSTTFGGTITGSGNLAKTGTGTFTLATASAYTGTTSISGGTLQAGAASVFVSPSAYTIGGSGTLDLNNFNQTLSSLGGSGNITLGSATLTLATATNPVFAGSISGSGGLTTTGSGIFTLSGSNAYTGATVLGSATLRAGAANAFSAGSQIVMAGATLDLSGFDQTIGSLSGNGTVSLGSANLFTGNDNTTTTLGGSISGSGSLIKNGTGTFTLSGANAYTGSTLVMNGTLQAGAAGAFAAGSTYGVDTNGTLALNGNSQTVGSLFGTGAVALGSATLTTGGDNTGTTFAGTISGSGGVTKAGSGSFVFNGTGSYTGTTEVQNGIFMVGDANNAGASLAGNVTIDPNGTLRGHGTIAGSIINNGILMPGGSIGTLTVASYAQSANGTLASEVAPAGSDKLNVIGNAAIDGTLALAFDPGFSPTQSFTLLDAGSITGQFANVTTTGASSLIATHLVYSAGAITLQLAPQLGLLTAIARTPNQQAVGNAFINAQNSPNADFTAALTAFETLPSNAAVLNALDAVSGVEHTATPVVALDNAFEFARMLQAHARDAGTGGWFQYDGGTNALIGNSNAPGYTVSMNGASAGFDGTAGNVHSGLAVASDRTNVATSNAMSSHATLDRSTLAAYAADNLGGVTLSAEIGLGTLHFASSDPIAFGSVQRSATGAAGGSEFTSALDARYNLRFGAATIAPHAGIAYANIGRDAFTETGAGALGLSVAATGVSIARSDAGLEVDLGGRGLHGSVRTDWLHDLSPISSPITAQFAGVGSASTLTIYGVTPARDAAVLGGTLAEPIGKFELFADVDANLSSNQTEESFDGGLRVRW